jgi:hypothetical protein
LNADVGAWRAINTEADNASILARGHLNAQRRNERREDPRSPITPSHEQFAPGKRQSIGIQRRVAADPAGSRRIREIVNLDSPTRIGDVGESTSYAYVTSVAKGWCSPNPSQVRWIRQVEYD